MKKHWHIGYILLTLCASISLSFLALFGDAATGVPEILNYQGRLLDSSGNLLGGSSGTNYCFRFSLYDASSGGTKLWPSGTPSIMTVNVKNGVFNVGIGDTSAGGDALDFNFQDNDEVYLNVEVENSSGGSCGGVTFGSEDALTPRQRIFAAGYAINASTIEGLGKTTGNLIVGSSTQWAALSVGADGRVLMASSTASNGLSWETVAGGSSALNDITDMTASSTIQIGSSAWEIGSGAASTTFAIDGDLGRVIANQLKLNASSTLLADLGLTIGTDVQAYDDELRDIASSTPTKGDLLTSDGTDWLDFAVGADGRVLMASSSAPNGLSWEVDQTGSTALDTIGDPTSSSTIEIASTTWTIDSAAASSVLEVNGDTGSVKVGRLTFAGGAITTPIIEMADDSTLTITDGTNTIFKLQDLSTNFGATVEAGAFIDFNSYWSEEFDHDRAQVIAAGANTWGDDLGVSVGETGACTWDVVDSGLGGYSNMIATTTADSCLLYISTTTSGTAHLIFDADNLPVVAMKVRPSVASTGVPDTDHQFYAGIGTHASYATPGLGAPTNFIGFSNCSSTDLATTCGTTWHAVTRNGSDANTTVSSSCGTVSETVFAVLLIKVKSTTSVEFWIDADASNGVYPTLCATHTTNINTAGMTMLIKDDFVANSNASTWEIDYVRVWQDDVPTSEIAVQQVQSDSLLEIEQTDNRAAARAVLMELLAQEPEVNEKTSHYEFTVDRLFAGLEVIAPRGLFDGLEVNTIGALDIAVTFSSDTIFFGRPYFNTDTAGFAVVEKGAKKVDVVFEKEYLQQPVVNATISLEKSEKSQETNVEEIIFENGVSYLVTKKSATGFTILLNKPAPMDLQFSWIALAVKNPKTFFSLKEATQSQQVQDPEPVSPDSIVPSDDEGDPPTAIEPSSEPPPAQEPDLPAESVPEEAEPSPEPPASPEVVSEPSSEPSTPESGE